MELPTKLNKLGRGYMNERGNESCLKKAGVELLIEACNDLDLSFTSASDLLAV